MEGEHRSRRSRLVSRLFVRDKKAAQDLDVYDGNSSLDDFLHGAATKLEVAHATPQILTKLDVSLGSRPRPLDVDIGFGFQHSFSLRNKVSKGLAVRFVETKPDLIGEGGDACTNPASDIKKPTPGHKDAQALNSTAHMPAIGPPVLHSEPPESQRTPSDHSILRRKPTGHSSKASVMPNTESTIQFEESTTDATSPLAHRSASLMSPMNEQHSSIIDSPKVQQTKSDDAIPTKAWAARKDSLVPMHYVDPQNLSFDRPLIYDDTSDTDRSFPHLSAASLAHDSRPSSDSTSLDSSSGRDTQSSVSTIPPLSPAHMISTSPSTFHTGDTALGKFVTRTRHLFAAFLLHAEVMGPLTSHQPTDVARAAAWWFLKGRMSLETSLRSQGKTHVGPVPDSLTRQQAYVNLAKAFWLCQEVLQVTFAKSQIMDGEAQEAQQAVLRALRQVAMLMERNDFMPSADADLPQLIDVCIWVPYDVAQPTQPLLQDLGATSIVSNAHSSPPLSPVRAFPLGDTEDAFCYGRFLASAILYQGSKGHEISCACILSVIRPRNDMGLEFRLVSQTPAIQYRIQDDSRIGPCWTDLEWNKKAGSLKIRLPQGLLMTVQFSPPDLQHLWSLQDYSHRARSVLSPRNGETLIWRSTLRNFRYMNADPDFHAFPREAIGSCELGLFELLVVERFPAGTRTVHRGFRLAVATGPATRRLSSISHVYRPQTPTRYQLLRDEWNEPALLLHFGDGESTGQMVASFHNEEDRMRFRTGLDGTKLPHEHRIISELPLQCMTISSSAGGFQELSMLPWSTVRVARLREHDNIPVGSSSEKLRIISDFAQGSVVDRVNVGLGEFQIRLSIKTMATLTVLRSPQPDMSASVREGQHPQEATDELSGALRLARENTTIRSYRFATINKLHSFQEAVTGFKVIFDEIASSLDINRGRTAMSTHKKWEAALTRVQVVQRGNLTQVLLFFENFAYGQCMSFIVKPTDLVECINKGDMAGLKIIDAKFPLPRLAQVHGGAFTVDETAFMSLDLPEIPSEHDDITVYFDNEQDRDELARSLPASQKVSRLSMKHRH